MRCAILVLSLISGLLLAGCASSTYLAPSGHADLAGVLGHAQPGVSAQTQSAHLPGMLAAVRVQQSGYQSYASERDAMVFGGGIFSVFTVYEVEAQADLDRLAKLREVTGLVPLTALHIPLRINAARDVLAACQEAHGELVLFYTFDTTFTDTDTSTTLQKFSLGFAKTHHVIVHTDVTANVLDARTGAIYATLTMADHASTQANRWHTAAEADLARQAAERAAFATLVDDLVAQWPAILANAHQAAK